MGFLPFGEPPGKGYEIAGYPVRCAHCGSTSFHHEQKQLNTTGFTAIGMDWANRSADVYICTTCGHIEWFDSR